MKVCILGGTGQLGYELSKDLEKFNFNVISLNTKDIDITNIDCCYRVLNNIKAEFVINAAAYTDIDGCEKSPELAYRINTIGTENIVKAIQKIGGKLIYISTDHVFSGNKGTSYNEYDNPDPINIYGKSKYDGEIITQQGLKEYFIVRTSTIFGHRRKNFIKTILNLTNNNTILNITDDLKRSPTYAVDFSTALVQLFNSENYGIYHIVNSGNCSWCEFIEYIFKIKNIDVKIIHKNDKDMYWKINPPGNISLNNNSPIKLRSWKSALEEYLRKE